MDNHVHFILYGLETTCDLFMEYYKPKKGYFDATPGYAAWGRIDFGRNRCQGSVIFRYIWKN